MGTFDPVRCGALLATLTTAGCAEVFGFEPPPALSNAGASTLYDGTARPAPAWPPLEARAELASCAPPCQGVWGAKHPIVDAREVPGPAVLVIKVPAGASVTVTWGQTAPVLDAPRSYRPSPYEAEPAPLPPYKPSPYENPPPPPTLYRMD